MEKFRNVKFPTKGSVLARFLALLVTNSVKDAAAIARLELKAVWQHRFGSRLVQGKELGIEEARDEKRKIVKQCGRTGAGWRWTVGGQAGPARSVSGLGRRTSQQSWARLSTSPRSQQRTSLWNLGLEE